MGADAGNEGRNFSSEVTAPNTRGEVLRCVVATDDVGKHLGSSSEHEGRRKI